jgi:hypothetical protein
LKYNLFTYAALLLDEVFMFHFLQRFMCILVMGGSLSLSLYSMEARASARWFSVRSLFSVGKTYVSHVASPLVHALKNSLSYVKAQPERVGLFATGVALFTVSYMYLKNVYNHKRQMQVAKQDADMAVALAQTKIAGAAETMAVVEALRGTIHDHEQQIAQLKQAKKTDDAEAMRIAGNLQGIIATNEQQITQNVQEIGILQKALKEKHEDFERAQGNLVALQKQQAESGSRDQETQQRLTRLLEELKIKFSEEVKAIKTELAAVRAEYANRVQAYKQDQQALADLKAEHQGCSQFMQEMEVERRDWQAKKDSLIEKLRIAAMMLMDVKTGTLLPANISLERIMRGADSLISSDLQGPATEVPASPVVPGSPRQSVNVSPLSAESVSVASAIGDIDPEVAEVLRGADAREQSSVLKLEAALKAIAEKSLPNVHLGDSPTSVLEKQSSRSAGLLLASPIPATDSPTLVRRRANSSALTALPSMNTAL